MRRTSTALLTATTALSLAFGLGGPIASPVGAIPAPGGGPVLTAECPELTGCIVPEPEPDPKVNPDLPSGGGQLLPADIDPCADDLLCPTEPDPDPELNPAVQPVGDGYTTEKPCIDDLLVPCPGGGNGGGGGKNTDDGDTDDGGEEPVDPGQGGGTDTDDDQPDDGGTDDSGGGTDDGTAGEETPEEPEDGQAPDPEGGSVVDLDTPRPGNPSFTG